MYQLDALHPRGKRYHKNLLPQQQAFLAKGKHSTHANQFNCRSQHFNNCTIEFQPFLRLEKRNSQSTPDNDNFKNMKVRQFINHINAQRE